MEELEETMGEAKLLAKGAQKEIKVKEVRLARTAKAIKYKIPDPLISSSSLNHKRLRAQVKILAIQTTELLL